MKEHIGWFLFYELPLLSIFASTVEFTCSLLHCWSKHVYKIVPLCIVVMQIFVLRDYARETLSLRWRSWMTKYYMERYLENQTFYKIQSQSIIDNPDQRIVDDLSSFTGTALSFSLTLFNAAVDLISFSNILYGVYPPLFLVLIIYSIGGTAISVFLGKVSTPFSQNTEIFPIKMVQVQLTGNCFTSNFRVWWL